MRDLIITTVLIKQFKTLETRARTGNLSANNLKSLITAI